MYVHEWHYRAGISKYTCVSGIIEGTYPNYMHKWHYTRGISKYTCMGGITEGKAKGNANPVQT